MSRLTFVRIGLVVADSKNYFINKIEEHLHKKGISFAQMEMTDYDFSIEFEIQHEKELAPSLFEEIKEICKHVIESMSCDEYVSTDNNFYWEAE
jgi:hypothetical protein